MGDPQPAVPRKMKVGFNYPHSFNRYGADVGPNPHVSLSQWNAEQKLANLGKASQIPLPPLFDHLDRNLRNLKKMGISVVRYFLLGNCFNYGLGPTNRNTPSPNPQLQFFDWDFAVPTRTDDRFKLHLRELLRRFAAANMKIIPSLIDFHAIGNSVPRDSKGIAPRGRMDCIKDNNDRFTFLNTFLADLLMESLPFKDTIFAWEVMNEPFWTASPIGPLSKPPISPLDRSFPLTGLARMPECDDLQLNTFFREAIQLIEALDFRSTVGHRFFRDIMDNVGAIRFAHGSRPQFHYYAKHALGFGDPPQIQGEKLFRKLFFNGRTRAFLGEFDSDFNSFGQAWPELQGNDTTLERLKLLRNEGCELALLWPDKDPNEGERKKRGLKLDLPDPIKLRQRTRAAIVQFTGGQLPTDDVTDDEFI